MDADQASTVRGQEVASLHVTVPTVEPTTDGKSLQFQIRTDVELRSGSRRTLTTARMFSELIQLQTRLGEQLSTVLVPVLPDTPNPSMVKDKTHMEKKRRQLERFFARLQARSVYWEHSDLLLFLSGQVMSAEPATPASTSAGKMSVLGALTARYDQGFRIYRPTMNIDDDEEAQFDKRRMYILQSERDHQDVLQRLAAVIRARAALGRSFSAVGSVLTDMEGSGRAYGGALLAVTEASVRVGTAVQEQMREEVFHFGDALIEYRNQAISFKVLLNHRTDLLADVEAAVRAHHAAKDTVDKTRRKHPETSSEVQRGLREVDKAAERVSQLREAYSATKAAIGREYDLASAQRLTDYRVALEEFVRVQLNAEQSVMAVLTDAHAHLQTFKSSF